MRFVGKEVKRIMDSRVVITSELSNFRQTKRARLNGKLSKTSQTLYLEWLRKGIGVKD